MKNTLAFDKAMTFRWHDEDGRLHVDKSNLTRVQVAPYRGTEIPGWDEKGLDPERVYYGYRPASELSDPETIRSVIGIPIQLNHHLDMPDDPAMETRVGSTGDVAEFDGTYLTNSLHIQNADACARIRDGSMKQLSLAYHYDPDFSESGEFKGQHYDFIMRRIRGQHLALVEDGRAGASCCVEDHAFQGEKTMTNEKPEGAQDGSPEVEKTEVGIADAMGMLADMLRGLHTTNETGETVDINQDEDKGAQIEKIKGAFKGLGADDEAIAALEEALKALAYEPAGTEGETAEEVNDSEPDEGNGLGQDAEESLKACGLDSEDPNIMKAFEAGKKFAEGQTAADEDGAEAQDEDTANDEQAEEEEADTNDEDQTSSVAQDTALKRLEAKFDALEDCRKVIGNVRPSAFDSAGSVYLTALKQLGAPMKGVNAKNAHAVYIGFVSGQKSATKGGIAEDSAPVETTGLDLAKGINVRI